MLIDLIGMWFLMLLWAVVGCVVGAVLVSGYVLIKDWSDRNVG